jgi:exopolyphosphatase/guanosine-5'-triphosphate,3'-diphosphate pyrophosphatase
MDSNSSEGKKIMKRIAGVDIGTNTILMSIADKSEDGNFNVIADYHEIARLGEGINHSGLINNNALSRAKEILKKFKTYCDSENVAEIRVAGTSALRDAKNNSDVIAELSEVLGAPVKVISGDDEASLSFLGASTGSSAAIVIDIGGGSTEFITGHNGHLDWLKSFQIGSVRLTEKFFSQHPPHLSELTEARDHLNDLFKGSIPVIDANTYGIGGTFTTIAGISRNLTEFESNSINGLELSLNDFESVLEKLLNSSVEQIVKDLNIHPGRADIITAGTLIAIEALKAISAQNCVISTNGLRTGLIYCDDIKWNEMKSLIDN